MSCELNEDWNVLERPRELLGVEQENETPPGIKRRAAPENMLIKMRKYSEPLNSGRYCKPCRRHVKSEGAWQSHVNGRWHKEQIAYIDAPPLVRCGECRDQFIFPHFGCNRQAQHVCCEICRVKVPTLHWNDHLNHENHRSRWAQCIDSGRTKKCDDCAAVVLVPLWNNHVALHKIMRKRRKTNPSSVFEGNTERNGSTEPVNNAAPREHPDSDTISTYTQSNVTRTCLECFVPVNSNNRVQHELGRRHLSNAALVDAPPRVQCRGCMSEFALPAKHGCIETVQRVYCRICDKSIIRSQWKLHVQDQDHFNRLKSCATELKHCDTCDITLLKVLWPDHVKRFRHPSNW